jgi:hypothetical protein
MCMCVYVCVCVSQAAAQAAAACAPSPSADPAPHPPLLYCSGLFLALTALFPRPGPRSEKKLVADEDFADAIDDEEDEADEALVTATANVLEGRRSVRDRGF